MRATFIDDGKQPTSNIDIENDIHVRFICIMPLFAICIIINVS